MRPWGLLLFIACNGRCRPDEEDCETEERRTFYEDADGDGHGDPLGAVERCDLPAGASTLGDDCDDQDASRWSAADQWSDADGDGFGAGTPVAVCSGAEGYAEEEGDCDDQDPARFPGAPVTCQDGVDQDCDDAPDCALPTGSGAVEEVAFTRFHGAAGSGLGSAVAGLGDLSGDGLADLGLGAPDADPWGSAVVFFSPTAPVEDATSADLALSAEVTDADADPIRLGAALAGADITGDGQRDLLVCSGEGYKEEAGSSTFIVPGPVQTGALSVNAEGASVLTVLQTGGDVVLATADYIGSEEVDLITGAGSVLLFPGPITTSGEDDDLSSGSLLSSVDGFGSALALGDLDGDGVLDLVVGASQLQGDLPDGGGVAENGAVFLFGSPADFQEDGGRGYATYDDLAIFGLSDQAGLGAAVAFAGDPNGDGYDDLWVGAPGALDADGAETGAVYLFDGATLAALDAESQIYADRASLTLYGGEADDELGASLLTGLQVEDQSALVVGAPGHDDETGAVALWYGEPEDGDTLYEADYRLSGTAEGDRFGATLANAGDTNGLGWDDLLIGAPGTSGGDGAGWLMVFDQL